MQTLIRILRQRSNRRGVVAVQLLQSLSIMVQNLTSDIAICERIQLSTFGVEMIYKPGSLRFFSMLISTHRPMNVLRFVQMVQSQLGLFR